MDGKEMNRSKPATRQKFTRVEASAYLRQHHGLRCKPATLAKLATRGGGPQYRKQGARVVIYDSMDLDIWAESKLTTPVTSTSELPPESKAIETEASPSESPAESEPANAEASRSEPSAESRFTQSETSTSDLPA
jgi:hypothetical protein